MIASVLLIAFTMSVALLFSPFVTDLVQDVQSGTSEKAINVQRASALGIKLEYVRFNRSSRELEAVIQNTGEAIDNETNVSISVVGGSVAETQTYNLDLDPREFTTLKVSLNRTYPLDDIRVDLTDYPVSDSSEIKCVPTGGLTGYWTLDNEHTENSWAVDLSKNRRNGSLENGVKTGVSGQVEEAYNFDGVDDYVDIGDAVWDSPANNDELTIIYWTNADALEDYQVAVGGKSGSSIWTEPWRSSSKGVSFRLTDTSGNKHTFESDYFIEKDKWYHLAFTYDGSEGEIYVNSRQRHSEQDSFDLNPASSGYIGSYNAGGNFFAGDIDQLQIFDRSLSKGEIKRTYSVSASWAVDGCKLTG